MVWLTDKRHLALFPASTIVRDTHHCESLTHHEQLCSSDDIKYSRLLSVLWMEMSSLLQEHCQQIKKVFSQSFTGNAYSSLPYDVWIVYTLNKR